jgi:hypothetical protein
VEVSSAQLLALPGTPVPLIPAPGVGFVIMIQDFFLRYIFKTTPYTPGNADNFFDVFYNSSVSYSNAMGFGYNLTGLVDQTENMIDWQSWANTVTQEGGDYGPIPQSQMENQGMNLNVYGTDAGMTLGDGTLEITLYYQLVGV